MPFFYQSGEEIKKGDRILYHREPGQVELVADDPNDADPEVKWHMEEHGGGIAIADPVFGHVFIPADQIAETEDLEFVSRADREAG
ncbi:MAG TPA: hypothetical protein VGT03_09970 [Candidatus Acidoferrales bacterium]|nr:hypothetical protein [Candidatus Acidoferrales bacterium]